MEIAGIDRRKPFKSWQGEGPYAGERIVGLRLMGCNLKCRWHTADGGLAWCDTKYTWDGSEKGETWDVDTLVKTVVQTSRKHLQPAKWEIMTWPNSPPLLALLVTRWKRAKIVMVTGGEPMLRQNSVPFQKVIEGLRTAGLKIHVETNGTQVPNEWARKNIDFFDVSPKYQPFSHSVKLGDYTSQKVKAWETCGVQVAWKFVIGTHRDVQDLRDWVIQMDMSSKDDVWLMPLTNDDKDMSHAEDVLSSGLIEAFKNLGYKDMGFKSVRYSPRLQITGKFP